LYSIHIYMTDKITNMLFAPHVIKNQDMEDYTSKQVNKYNLQINIF
jgi:hypothetical protein